MGFNTAFTVVILLHTQLRGLQKICNTLCMYKDNQDIKDFRAEIFFFSSNDNMILINECSSSNFLFICKLCLNFFRHYLIAVYPGLWKLGFSSFQQRDTKLDRFLAKNQHTPRNFSYFVNRQVVKNLSVLKIELVGLLCTPLQFANEKEITATAFIYQKHIVI